MAVEQRLCQPQPLGGGSGSVSRTGSRHPSGDRDDASIRINWSHSFGQRVKLTYFLSLSYTLIIAECW